MTSGGGLISAILGQVKPATGDDGAQAALRTLPKRSTLNTDRSDPAAAQRAKHARIELLLSIADDQQGPARARSLTQAAELLSQQSDIERALALYNRALEADPNNRIAELALRRHAQRVLPPQQAAEPWSKLAERAGDARERGLALCMAAELHSQLAADADSRAQTIATLTRAVQANPASLLARLLLAREQLHAGQIEAYAATLQEAADVTHNPSTRALLLLEAGRAYEISQRSDAARACYEAARSGDPHAPHALGPLLGLVRLHNGGRDRRAAVEALAALAAISGDGLLAAEWSRQRGVMLLDSLGEAAQASLVLRSQTSASGLRALARAAQATADQPTHEAALAAWTRAGSSALHDAQTQATSRPQASSTGIQATLHAAALACATQAGAAAEYALLQQVPADDPGFLCADVVGFDVAAEVRDFSQLADALAREAARGPEDVRVGTWLSSFAAVELSARMEAQRAQANDERVHMQRYAALQTLARGQAVVTRFLAARAADPEVSAALWLSEARATSGEHAAYAATQAGRALERAGRDPSSAYAEALDAVPGYLPAAFALEIHARELGDLTTLARVQHELTEHSPSPAERSARRVRLGLLLASADMIEAAQQLQLAAGSAADPVLDEFAVRLSLDQPPAQRAQLLRSLAERSRSIAYARAFALQAAFAYEQAGQWPHAIGIYQGLHARDPEDLLADLSGLLCSHKRGDAQALSEELGRRARQSQNAAQRALFFEDLAHFEAARGYGTRARALLETHVVDTDAGRSSVGALRALQRDALLNGDDARQWHWSLRLSEAVQDAQARSAELRMAVRAGRRLGADLTNTLLPAEGHVREQWYALELERIALRTHDRARSRDAMLLLNELAPVATAQGAMERAAFALRAANALHSTDPEPIRTAIVQALGRAHEHPLAVEQLAHLHWAADDFAAAAYSFERAARSSASPTRRAQLHYAAGVLFQDQLNDQPRAIENLALTAHEDLAYKDTFTRLRGLYAQSKRTKELVALLDARLHLPLEDALRRELHWQRQALCVSLGELTEAQHSLQAVLNLQPDDREALSALAHVYTELGNYADATETLQQLMHQLDAPQDIAQVLVRLSDLYERELHDPERAHTALERAYALAPEDPSVLRQLSVLHARQGRSEDALRVAAKAVESAPLGPLRDQAMVRQANLLELLGQHTAAQEVLAQARKASPASLIVVRAQTAALERQGDPDALANHLSNACEALRRAILEDPAAVESWLDLCELLYARGRGDAARLVGHAAKAFGLEHVDLPDDTVHGLGAAAWSASVLSELSPRNALEPLRVLLCELGYALDPYLPFEARGSDVALATDAAPAATDSVTDVAKAQAAIAEFVRNNATGLAPEQLGLTESEAAVCLPIAETPLTLCVGEPWLSQAPAPERHFAWMRALAVAKLDFTLLVRPTPARLGQVIDALGVLADPTSAARTPSGLERDRIASELSKRLRPVQRVRAENLFIDIAARDDLTPEHLAGLAYAAGTQVALCVTGKLSAGIACLVRMSGREPEKTVLADRLALCRTDASLRELLCFAISERYADIRRYALTHAVPQRV